MDILAKLSAVVSGEIRQNESLKDKTSWRLGGPAAYFYSTGDENEVMALVKTCQQENAPFFILGGGSNILISDAGFNGLVIRFSNSDIKINDKIVECGAGLMLGKLINETLSNNLAGLEWAAGIPGTVGGAVHNNAGAYGGEMSQSVESVRVFRDNQIQELKNSECGFVYRGSNFKTDSNHDIIFSIRLRLSSGDVGLAREKMKEITHKRQEKIPQGFSAGSVFKNFHFSDSELTEFLEKFPDLPAEFIKNKVIPASWLIDQCGLKGKKIGGVTIAEKHAGFIINDGTAAAENVIMLVSIIKQKVRAKFNLQLNEEIEYIGF